MPGFPQTDIIVTQHRARVERPNTLLYFQILGQQLGLSWAQIDVGRGVLELVDGYELDGGDLASIEATPEAGIPALLQRDLEAKVWDHLPLENRWPVYLAAVMASAEAAAALFVQEVERDGGDILTATVGDWDAEAFRTECNEAVWGPADEAWVVWKDTFDARLAKRRAALRSTEA